jgi:hypothetical protein
VGRAHQAGARMTGEIWRPTDFEGYEVSSLGRVRSLARIVRCGPSPGFRLAPERVLKNIWNRRYFIVTLSVGNAHTNRCVHVLVCTAFAGPRPSSAHEVAHCDGDPRNNHADNLRWDTGAGNAADRIKHGTHQLGERGSKAKVTNAQAAEIRLLGDTTALSYREIGERFGLSKQAVRDIIKRRHFSHPLCRVEGCEDVLETVARAGVPLRGWL